MARKRATRKAVEALTHDEATRKNIPTAEYQPVMQKEEQAPVRVDYERGAVGLDEEKQARNRDLDPQLVWRGKDEQDWSDLVVHAPPLYIQEKIHPKVLIDDLMRQSSHPSPPGGRGAGGEGQPEQIDLFADFNGMPEEADKTDFYQHDANWTNRMILGDSLQVMASLSEREGLRGKVQCIYIDPPYGIKFNSNFQWSTTSRDVKDGNVQHITREPEQVKAFRDTWRDGIHSYLTYLRDRLTVARDLLTDSGAVFVQIGDENVHRLRSLMDEVFGDEGFIAQIAVQKTTSATNVNLPLVTDFLLWYAKRKDAVKYRAIYKAKGHVEGGAAHYGQVVEANGVLRAATELEKLGINALPRGADFLTPDNLQSASMGRDKGEGAASWFPVDFSGRIFRPTEKTRWKTNEDGMARLLKAGRVVAQQQAIRYGRRLTDFGVYGLNNLWTDLGGAPNRQFVVETTPKAVQRCILMCTDPGDLVLDPTCGSGTTAYVAEQWGRRWITIDTSRVALALARARIMGARYPYFLLADSKAGQLKEAEITRTAPSSQPTHGDIRQGFVYQRVPHITLKSIANNAEIDVIWEKWQPQVQDALDRLNAALRGHATPHEVTTGGRQGKQIHFDAPEDSTFAMPSGETVPAHALVEWEVPRDPPSDWSLTTQPLITDFWQARIARQREIDASIAAKADSEYLYDKPYEDKGTVRVAGPFTVESLSPHRVLGVDEDDELIGVEDGKDGYGEERDFVSMILENLKTAGVQQAHKEDKISFRSLKPWPGELICAEGSYTEGEEDSGTEKRAAIFIGSEFGTVSRPDLVAAAREAGDADFDVLITCAFNYDAHSSEFNKLGRIPVLKARMNADLHMADDLKNTGKGNLFVIFGEPDIDILDAPESDPESDQAGQIQVKINGVDVFHPQTGEVRSDGPEGIACWLVDTDYNEESFFVRHAYFLGANDPYKALKTTLKAEIDQEAWESLHSDTSRPFPKPVSRRIAVKVINHLGDEVMKVFRV